MARKHGSGPQCPNGHASTSGGQCTISSCAHCDPSVNARTRNKGGLFFGTPKDHGVQRKGLCHDAGPAIASGNAVCELTQGHPGKHSGWGKVWD